MYQAANRHHHFLQALASDGSILNELIDFLEVKRSNYTEELHKAAVIALDDKNNAPYALRQAGAVAALDDLIFILSSYKKK